MHHIIGKGVTYVLYQFYRCDIMYVIFSFSKYVDI